MKKFALSALFVASILAAPAVAKDPSAPKAATSTKAAAVYKVQPQLSTLGWVGKKVTGQHNGTIQFKSGDVEVKGNQITGGTFLIDMNSLKVEDLKDAEYAGKLVGHLRSDDFFSIEKNPTSTFKITKITPIKGAAADANNATVTGNLTIKGITKPISFPAKIGVKNGVAAASGTATIDRTQFDIKYGSKSFFESIGDKAIDNDFTLSFNVIAKQ
ncbi:YceI family protein [Hymenobacter aquaticus]|uniref:YceI family protein n=1 Tax=Hymenobacter aquaticus TaxID=1867101 RepID=A0A4Z0Q8M8_9BACT|nr:YceI family protein [Hymenobacter aquaticus]TGE25421.1 YceI family protein [Hymenobacter aquaticus]